jgi:hypothetical protein
MKSNLILLGLVMLTNCSPKNPYYDVFVETRPYIHVFESMQQHSAYKIIGEHKVSKNIFNCILPDSFGGNSTIGDCVVEIQIDNRKKEIKNISLVGMSVTNKQTDISRGFDRYQKSFRRVHYKLYNGVNNYMPFIRSVVKEFTFERLDSSNKKMGIAYCGLIFGNASNLEFQDIVPNTNR